MSDILTQLQTQHDQLLTQFYSTLSYLSQRHPIIAPDADPDDPYTTLYPNPSSTIVVDGTTTLEPSADESDPLKTPRPLLPDTPKAFREAQEELAEDLAQKTEEIEFLISRLPGQGRSEEEQEARIRELAERVREVEKTRKAKRREMRDLVKRLDDVVMGMATSIDIPPVEGETNGNSIVNGANRHK